MVEGRFSPGDLLRVDFDLNMPTRVFEAPSDWSKVHTPRLQSTALVLQVPSRMTGSGFRWHRVLLSEDGNPRLTWIEGTWGWKVLA